MPFYTVNHVRPLIFQFTVFSASWCLVSSVSCRRFLCVRLNIVSWLLKKSSETRQKSKSKGTNIIMYIYIYIIGDYRFDSGWSHLSFKCETLWIKVFKLETLSYLSSFTAQQFDEQPHCFPSSLDRTESSFIINPAGDLWPDNYCNSFSSVWRNCTGDDCLVSSQDSCLKCKTMKSDVLAVIWTQWSVVK